MEMAPQNISLMVLLVSISKSHISSRMMMKMVNQMLKMMNVVKSKIKTEEPFNQLSMETPFSQLEPEVQQLDQLPERLSLKSL